MTSELDIIVLIVMGTAIVFLVAWALLGPRRRTDERGHHVELAEATRQRDEGRRQRDPTAQREGE
jgi:hypothetical protein